MTNTYDIVQKLWRLCDVLRDDGITYHEYVTELTYLLFLKMAKEQKTESAFPDGYRWDDLVKRDGIELLNFYKELLLKLGTEGDERVKSIYVDATTALRQPKNLRELITNIDELDWYASDKEQLGEAYEGLLQKNADEKKSGAGQYFTPRALIQCIVEVVKPQVGETIHDPAAGTAGFLIASDSYIKEKTDGYFKISETKQNFQKKLAFSGIELVPDTRRLALMNLHLHNIEAQIKDADALSSDNDKPELVDIILTNPPFGSKKGGKKPTGEFTYPTSNKQLLFLQRIYNGLRPGGRAAVILPDNVLFEGGVGKEVRKDLMNKCNLHTILRLPTGIFYAQGVKTNVLFFQRGEAEKDNTKEIWYYDYRTNIDPFGKRNVLTKEHFSEFFKCFGEDPNGSSNRKDLGEDGRFRKFTRDEIKNRDESLDITWLMSGENGKEELPDPDIIAAQIMEHLQSAMNEMEALAELLNDEEAENE